MDNYTHTYETIGQNQFVQACISTKFYENHWNMFAIPFLRYDLGIFLDIAFTKTNNFVTIIEVNFRKIRKH